MKWDYDMVVIGGGAAGLTAAGISAVLGAKTLLIEVSKLGGDCTWHGCIPSKSLLRAARAAQEMRSADRFGLTAAAPEHDFSRVMERVRGIREQIYTDVDAPPNMEKLGVEVRIGHARFTDAHTIQVAGAAKITSRYFMIATGSVPRAPQVPGGDLPHVLNNETLFEIGELPGRLLVLGAGPVAIEMAQAFQRLGSHVTVLHRGHTIMKRDDPELTQLLLDHLRKEGIQFVLGAELARIDRRAVYTKDGQCLAADAVLSALGRKPNIDSLDLAAAGVAANEKGIIVNRRCRSSASHIYAIGDVTGRHMFTHMAEEMAKVAVQNAILHLPASMDERRVPWCTFTGPELAHAGKNEADLQRDGVEYAVYRFPFRELDRAIADSAPVGLVKVLAGRWGRIFGASILGAHAGEMIGEFAVAMRNGIRLSGISSTIHPYPTYGMGNRRAADLYYTRMLSPRLIHWIQRLFGLRGSDKGASALTHGEK